MFPSVYPELAWNLNLMMLFLSHWHALFKDIVLDFTVMICFHCRRWVLERKLASSDVPKEEQMNLIKDLERKETEFMRLKRHKICVDDFELLTIIGRGAFGEVRNVHDTWAVHWTIHHSLNSHVRHYILSPFAALNIFVSHVFSNYRFDCVGRRNLAIFMPWKSWRNLKC